MSRLMVAFIDGLAHEHVDPAVMPYVGALPRVRVRSQAGFSTTCWGNLWTGVYPDRHGHWFHIVRSPETSPFGPARWVPAPLYRLTPALARMVWLRLLSLRRRNRSVFGYPFMHFVHPHHWPLFDVVEDRVFGESGFYAPQRYLFEYLEEAGVTCTLLGVHREIRKMQQGVETLRHQLAGDPDVRTPDFVFLLFGDIDYLAHYTGPDSPETRERLRVIDRYIAEIHERSGDRELIVLSDHGHLPIREKIDIYTQVPELARLPHQVEDMYVRVWTEREEERARMEGRLAAVPGLRLLGDEELRRHRLPTDRQRHGHVIAVLEHGRSFLRTSWTRYNKFVSDHGYLPDHPELDAFYAATFLDGDPGDARLVDFLPTIFDLIGIASHPGLEGRSLLRGAPVGQAPRAVS